MSKAHTLDFFAKKIAAPFVSAVRGLLGVFEAREGAVWPLSDLLGQLRAAEALARDMLREIAAKLTVLPRKVCERMGEPKGVVKADGPLPPCFRLGIAKKTDAQDSTDVSCHPGHDEARDAAPQPTIPGSGTPSAEDRPLGQFDRRIDALEDVLAHPGRHGARMARALYRAEHESAERLSVSSDIGLLMDRVNHDMDHHGRASTDDFARLHDWVMNYDSS